MPGARPNGRAVSARDPTRCRRSLLWNRSSAALSTAYGPWSSHMTNSTLSPICSRQLPARRQHVQGVHPSRHPPDRRARRTGRPEHRTSRAGRTLRPCPLREALHSGYGRRRESSLSNRSPTAAAACAHSRPSTASAVDDCGRPCPEPSLLRNLLAAHANRYAA